MDYFKKKKKKKKKSQLLEMSNGNHTSAGSPVAWPREDAFSCAAVSSGAPALDDAIAAARQLYSLSKRHTAPTRDRSMVVKHAGDERLGIRVADAVSTIATTLGWRQDQAQL